MNYRGHMTAQPVNLTAALASFDDIYSPRIVTRMNDYDVRIVKLQGDFTWHKHDDTDEFFLVMEGHLDIELEGKMVSLDPGQAFTVPKGVMHCPHARGRSVVLMVEQAGVVPTGS